MAANLATGGFDLVVYNRTVAKAEAFAESHGTRVAGSLAELAAASDVIVTMVADGEALVSVYDQAEPEIQAGSVAIDMGTSGTEAVAAVRRRLENKGALLVDAPVSGSTPAAEAASLLIMVGATPEVFATVSPVLEAIGRPELVGPPGAGAALKLTVNSILYALNQAFAEGVALAEAAGVAPATTQDVVARSAAGAPLISYRKPQYLDPEHAPVTFTLNLSAKDLHLALAAAAGAGVPMPQLERTMETVQALIAAGHGDRDMGFVVEAARRASS